MELISEKNFVKLPEEPVKLGLGLSLCLTAKEVAAYLYDLKTGDCLGAKKDVNAQTVLFPVSSEIPDEAYEEMLICFAFGNDEKALQLTALLREQVYDLASSLSANAGRSALEIHYISIAGTTLMQHLYAAMPVLTLRGQEGFPLSLFGEEIIAEPTMYYFPCASKQCGGLSSAASLAAEVLSDTDTDLFLNAQQGACLGLSGKYRELIKKPAPLAEENSD